MGNEKRIEELQETVLTLIRGLNSVSLSLELLMSYEDMIFNNWYDEALIFLNNKSLESPSLNDFDRLALIFVFEYAVQKYSSLV